MILKKKNFLRCVLSPFDLFGKDEEGLSKAFAYTIAKEPKALYGFLHYLGLSVKNTKNNFKSTSIQLEKKYRVKRTDIEIKQKNKFHIIIECKVRKNKVLKQRRQYLNCFDDVPCKIMCFITQVNDYQVQKYKDIKVCNIGWIEIINIYNDRKYENCPIIIDFIKFTMKGYKMREQKEILVQDLSKENEMKRYREYNVYRRNVVFGNPLYFSPYFTQKANQLEGKGISFLSKILGILTLRPAEIVNYEDDLKEFAGGKKNLVKKWMNGVSIDKNSDKTYTYFFLDDPVKLNKPLLKDRGRETGRGKNWIAAMIPKNRCVSFDEFVKRIVAK